MSPCFTVLDAIFTEQKMVHFCHFLASFKVPLNCGKTAICRNHRNGWMGLLHLQLHADCARHHACFNLLLAPGYKMCAAAPDASSPRIHRNAVQFTVSLGVPSTSLCPSCHHARPSVACLLMQSPSPSLPLRTPPSASMLWPCSAAPARRPCCIRSAAVSKIAASM
jgi:hypothetical protein